MDVDTSLTSHPTDDLKQSRLIILLYTLLLTASFALFQWTFPSMILDEFKHTALIRFILTGQFSVEAMERSQLPMLPGYHFAMAAWGKLLGTHFQTLRWISFLHSLILIPAVILAARVHQRENWLPRSMQVLLLPWLPVMTWLIYTDVASMVYVVLGFYFWRTRRFGYSAAMLTVACLIRQNNIIWPVSFATIQLVEEAGMSPSGLVNTLRKRFVSLLPFTVPVIIVLSILVYRGKLTMGHWGFHPGGIHPTQIYFLALLFFVLFAPQLLKDIERQVQCWKERLVAKRYLGLVLFVVLYLIYMLTIDNSHPFNQTLKMMGKLYDSDDYIIRFLDWNFFTRSAGFLMLWISGEYLLEQVRISSRPIQLVGLLVASLLFLLPSWLISIRYSLIPMTMLTLSSGEPAITDKTTLVWYLTLTLAVTVAVVSKLILW